MAKLFISYRRADSQHAVDRLYQTLRKHMAKKDIFIDVDSIPKGVDFADHLARQVDQCETLLAIVGPQWLSLTDETGLRRLDSLDDFVRIEIATALKRNILVIPVLLDGTPMPRAEQLPDDLKALERRNAAILTRNNFRGDMDRLIVDLGLRRRMNRLVPAFSLGITLAAGLSVLFAAGTLPLKPSDMPKVFPQEAGALGAAEATPHTALGEGIKPPARNLFRDKIDGFAEDAVPEMVVIPAGTFTMGSAASGPSTEIGRQEHEGPLRTVTIGTGFAVGRYEVTWTQWEACVADGGCDRLAPENRSGTDMARHPVTGVTWGDANSYAAWLSDETGQHYRLLSEAEWEYAARAGTTTPFSFGATISTHQANFDGRYTYGAGAPGISRQTTTPVGSGSSNAFGLYDMHGNVFEWVQDCWNASYEAAPVDGSAWTVGDCAHHVMRGGSFGHPPEDVRSAARAMDKPTHYDGSLGFRVARTL